MEPIDSTPGGNSQVIAAIRWQADYTARSAAPITSRIVAAELALLDHDSAVGRRLAHWPGNAMEDALPLRLAGGLHDLYLTGAELRLDPVYRGDLTDQGAIDALVRAVVADHDARLLPWLDGPPQTNEAGRSASTMAALAWLSGRVGPRFELNELGASAGINVMMGRFAYDLCGVAFGPADSPLRLAPEW